MRRSCHRSKPATICSTAKCAPQLSSIAAIKPLAQQNQDGLDVNTTRYRRSCRASSTMHTEEEPPSHQMRTSRERLQTWIALSFLSCQQRNDSKERTGTKPPSPGCQANEARSRCWFRRERAFSPGGGLLDGRLWRESFSVERLSGTLLHLVSTASSIYCIIQGLNFMCST